MYLYAPEINGPFSRLYDEIHEAQYVMNFQEHFTTSDYITDIAEEIYSKAKPAAKKALEDMVR